MSVCVCVRVLVFEMLVCECVRVCECASVGVSIIIDLVRKEGASRLQSPPPTRLAGSGWQSKPADRKFIFWGFFPAFSGY